MIVATAVLIAWLLVELARLALGGAPFPRLHLGSLQGASPGPSALAAPAPSSGISTPSESVSHAVGGEEQVTANGTANPPPADPGATADNGLLSDDADVEWATRDRLYGGRGRRRT